MSLSTPYVSAIDKARGNITVQRLPFDFIGTCAGEGGGGCQGRDSIRGKIGCEPD